MRTLLAVLLCFGLNACFPYQYTMRSSITGTVIDAQTQKPIPGASVSITSNRFGLKDGTATARTHHSGAFYIPPFHQWGIFIVPQGILSTDDTVSFRCSGYTGINKEVFNSGDRVKQLGIIALKPKIRRLSN